MTAEMVSTYHRYSQIAGRLEISGKFIFMAESALIEKLKTLV